MKTIAKFLCMIAFGYFFNNCTNSTTPATADAPAAQAPAAETPASEAPTGKRPAFDGSYQHEGNSDEFNAEMTIQHLGNDRFSFKISTGTASGCTGDVEGESSIGIDGTATFSAPDCEMLKFTFEMGKITVEEKGCDANHGMRCPYGGVYKHT